MAQTPATGLPTIGDVVLAWRKFRGLRSTELVQKAGIKKGYLSALEHNKRTTPQEAFLAKLADALDVPLQDIYGRRMPPKNKGAITTPSSKQGGAVQGSQQISTEEDGDSEAKVDEDQAIFSLPASDRLVAIGTLGSGVSLSPLPPPCRTSQQQTDTASQQHHQTIKLLVAQIAAEGQLKLTPAKRMLAEHLILENARSVCEVLAKE